MCCAVKPLLSSQSDCIRKPTEAQPSCTSYAPASSNLIFFFSWSHGFHGNSPIVLTGSGEGCISSIIFHYKTHTRIHARTHTHTHELGCVMPFDQWNWRKGDGDCSSGDIPGASDVWWKIKNVGWHLKMKILIQNPPTIIMILIVKECGEICITINTLILR